MLTLRSPTNIYAEVPGFPAVSVYIPDGSTNTIYVRLRGNYATLPSRDVFNVLLSGSTLPNMAVATTFLAQGLLIGVPEAAAIATFLFGPVMKPFTFIWGDDNTGISFTVHGTDLAHAIERITGEVRMARNWHEGV